MSFWQRYPQTYVTSDERNILNVFFFSITYVLLRRLLVFVFRFVFAMNSMVSLQLMNICFALWCFPSLFIVDHILLITHEALVKVTMKAYTTIYIMWFINFLQDMVNLNLYNAKVVEKEISQMVRNIVMLMTRLTNCFNHSDYLSYQLILCLVVTFDLKNNLLTLSDTIPIKSFTCVVANVMTCQIYDLQRRISYRASHVPSTCIDINLTVASREMK